MKLSEVISTFLRSTTVSSQQKKDFHIKSCLANNEEAADSDGYFEVELVDQGCVADSNSEPLKTIVPTLTNDEKTLNFNQFGFISKTDSGDIDLKFQLICVLSFGTAPDCTSAASRRQYAEKNTKNYELSKFKHSRFLYQ